MDALPDDVIERVKQDFREDKVGTVLELLSEYDGKEPGRVIRCIVHLSEGSESLLLSNLETAYKDYRDIIYFAEYDRADNHLHDFQQPFTFEHGA
jgi:hypothetical protein